MNPRELEVFILRKKSFLCVGLDPDLDRFPVCLRQEDPVAAVIEFNRNIIEATLPYAVAYKPNFAFYEALGPRGHEALEQTLQAIPPEYFVIADAKRGDIGNTSDRYASAVFSLPGVDAVTVSPYMGKDSVMPFLSYPGKWVFLLALTSNAGAQDFQYLESNGKKVYEWVVETSAQWPNEHSGHLGYVAGATHPDALSGLRRLAPEAFFLVPGVGAQGGEANAVVQALAPRVLINAGRQILYASDGADYAEAAAAEARKLQATFAHWF